MATEREATKVKKIDAVIDGNEVLFGVQWQSKSIVGRTPILPTDSIPFIMESEMASCHEKKLSLHSATTGPIKDGAATKK